MSLLLPSRSYLRGFFSAAIGIGRPLFGARKGSRTDKDHGQNCVPSSFSLSLLRIFLVGMRQKKLSVGLSLGRELPHRTPLINLVRSGRERRKTYRRDKLSASACYTKRTPSNWNLLTHAVIFIGMWYHYVV